MAESTDRSHREMDRDERCAARKRKNNERLPGDETRNDTSKGGMTDWR